MVRFCPSCKSTDIRSDYSFAASEYLICNKCGYRSVLFPETEDLSKVKNEDKGKAIINAEESGFKRSMHKALPFILLTIYILAPLIIVLLILLGLR